MHHRYCASATISTGDRIVGGEISIADVEHAFERMANWKPRSHFRVGWSVCVAT
jgi:hypothetical protein